jgi:hypothetical protein
MIKILSQNKETTQEELYSCPKRWNKLDSS